MLFSSLEFIGFLLIFYFAYRICPASLKLSLITLSSLVFYAWWNPTHVFVPIGLIISSYLLSIIIYLSPSSRKSALFLPIFIITIPLLWVKYSAFIGSNLCFILRCPDNTAFPVYALPLGISFITFTLISYLIDVWRGRLQRIPSPLEFFSYILFFPQLIAGPILRTSELLPQFKSLRLPLASISRLRFPFFLFTVGLVKKLVFADQLAKLVDPVFSDSFHVDLPSAIFAVYGFTAQI